MVIYGIARIQKNDLTYGGLSVIISLVSNNAGVVQW